MTRGLAWAVLVGVLLVAAATGLAAPPPPDTPFDHAAHDRRAAAPCARCHAGGTTAEPAPRPTARSCETGCHDGVRAFGLREERCTRCHTRPEPTPPLVTVRRYDHAAHLGRGAAAPCESCHALDASGRPAPIRHAACADAACHASEFGTRTPMLCGACHLGNEPWRRQGTDRSWRADSAFGVEFDHARAPHAVPCLTCHTGIPVRPPPGAAPTKPMRVGPAHAACSGAACHAVQGGAAPTLTRCEACHVPGLLAARGPARAAAPWSVAARFDHARHAAKAQDPADGRCAACHASVRGATRLADLAPPAKATCQPCHDGRRAFKLTGPACARCHGAPAAKTL